ncbi:MAG: hypothetical protein FWH40_02545 [Coriobacteriia bacterium]|nr:hypothetical protein [Coriobacteriia bacterium]
MYIYPKRAQSQLEGQISSAHELEDKHRNLVKSLDSIASDTVLSGQAYDALKSQVMLYDLPLASGYVSFSVCLASVYRAHFDYIGKYFPELPDYISSDDINEQIRSLKDRIAELNRWYHWALSVVVLFYGLANQSQIAYLQNLVRKLEEKLSLMSQFETTTRSLYSDSDTLATTLYRGVKSTGSLVWDNGWTSLVSKYDTSWPEDLKQQIDATWWNLIERSQDFVYTDERGLFGGSQRGPKDYFKNSDLRNSELLPILKRYEAFKNMTDKEQRELLSQINSTGCGYTVLANSIMEQYFFRPEDFERDFGFPLFRTEKGKQVLNYEMLLVDIYCARMQEQMNASGESTIPYKGLHPSDPFFSTYIADKTEKQSVTTYWTYSLPDEAAKMLHENNIAIHNGVEKVEYIGVQPGVPNVSFTGSHSVMVRSIDDSSGTPVYTVSSWGQEYQTEDMAIFYIITWSSP